MTRWQPTTLAFAAAALFWAPGQAQAQAVWVAPARPAPVVVWPAAPAWQVGPTWTAAPAWGGRRYYRYRPYRNRVAFYGARGPRGRGFVAYRRW